MKLIVTLLFTLFSSVIYALPSHVQEAKKNNHVDEQASVNKILLVVAMDIEAHPIIKKLNLKKMPHLFPGLPMQGYEGKYANKHIFLIINGQDPVYKVDSIATQPAVLSTYLGIQYFHPDLVISTGTAGGIVENGAEINDIYVSQKIYFYDRRIPAIHAQYGLGGYVSANFDRITSKMKVKKGIICTSNSFDISPTDKEIILQNKCAAAEMEAGSVAWVSLLMKTPMLAIKGVGDIAGSQYSHKDYIANGGNICNKIADTVKDFINHLASDKNSIKIENIA